MWSEGQGSKKGKEESVGSERKKVTKGPRKQSGAEKKDNRQRQADEGFYLKK